MAEKLNLPELPNSPMFEGSTEIMTIEWQEFFRVLFVRVGDMDTVTLSDSIVDLIAGTYSTPINFGNRIDDLERKMNSFPDQRNYSKELSNLETLIHADPSHDFKIQVPIVLDYFDAVPSRATVSNWHGGLLSLVTGQPLNSVPTDISVTKGIGKVLIVINAGSDVNGEITITGETIDRNTGVSTLGDTETITVDALTTDNSTVDSNGNTVNKFVGAYISTKWFTGSTVLSTTDLTLTDVDVYHASFEQANDSPDLTLNTFDANIYTTNVNAEFDAYLNTMHVTGSKCNVANDAELHVGADGQTAIANTYWRLRRGNIEEFIDGVKDGFWVDIYYANSPVYVEDVTISVWLTKTILAR